MYSKSENYKIVIESMNFIIDFLKSNAENKKLDFKVLKEPYILEND